jgi:hypothetical protein
LIRSWRQAWLRWNTRESWTETLKARSAWSEVFQALNENNFNPRILYPAKLSLKIEQ